MVESLKKDSSPSQHTQPQQGLLPFILVEEKKNTSITSFAGIPLVIETMEALKLPEIVKKHLHIKKRDTGYSEYEYLKSLVVLFASGGDCLEDLERVASDEGLKRLISRIPSPEAMRFFLYAFHDERLLAARPPEGAFIPEETEGLKELGEVNREMILRATKDSEAISATLDIDAVVVEANKREAYYTYLGERGYQPVNVYWVEEDLIIADQFRDGNVPAGMELHSILGKAIEVLPRNIKVVYVRSDSAGYYHKLLNKCRGGIDGRKVKFAITADMSEELRKQIQQIPNNEWERLKKVDEFGEWDDERREWAEVNFVPSGGPTKKGVEPDRYIAIRVSPSQMELFPDGNEYQFYAVVTNIWEWEGDEVIRWHRKKCGSIEKVMDVLKNDLACGVLPCGRFYANAAWWRINCITYNIISIMKRKALPESWWKYRMKALRFRLLNIAGQVISHGRRIYLRICDWYQSFTIYMQGRQRLLFFSSA